MASRVDVPNLRESDGGKCCEKCRYFTSSIMTYPAGWCGQYHSFQANTGIGMVCDKWKNKYVRKSYYRKKR